MDYNTFCRNEKGEWLREKEYEWIFTKVEAEFNSGNFGEYTRQVAKGDDISLITALLFETGLKSEGLMTPLLGKKIFSEPSDTNYVFDLISNHVTREQFQTLLDKYIKIKKEFTKRYKAHQDLTEKKYGNESKPQRKIKSFKIG